MGVGWGRRSLSSRVKDNPDGEPAGPRVGSLGWRGASKGLGMECVDGGSAAIWERRDRTAQRRRFPATSSWVG